ncbi:HpcH/HpaI aldolase/citrate lyase family protein [Brevibacillus sp. SYSU BS000544]|uniref:HpcH/HpaI aldolase/citrate lyase family protein n=1 Tax=Brevibacillus sp. SYSU BS000544 TaxID=3416443 RepID=UPI003CE5A34B
MRWEMVRSILYFSCLNINERTPEKLAALPTDMILLDLEDAIPVHERPAARNKIREHFYFLRNQLPQIALRMNSIQTTDGLRDVLFLCEHVLHFDMILMPMVEDPQEIVMVRKILNEHNLFSSIFALIETPKGIENVSQIASECDGLFYGGADYCSIIGIDIAKNTRLIDYATSKIVNAAAMYGLPAYDTPCFKMNDLPYLENESKTAFQQGFTGKQAIHPQQLPIINECFTQPDHRLKWANEILDATKQGSGRIIKTNNTMVGPPFIKLAQKILATASEKPTESSLI